MAAPLTAGSARSEGVNRPGRRCEDDVNLVFTELGEGHQSYQQADVISSLRTSTGGGGQMANRVAETLNCGTGTGGFRTEPGAHLVTEAYGGNNTRGSLDVVATGMAVRRLTPLECCRLQGFPDAWLEIDPPLSDSAKYRMLGNAVCVAVSRWIGQRIMMVAGKKKDE